MFSLGKSAVACSSLLQASTAVAAATTTATRGVARIPHWEYHIRFSPKDGRKRPAQDVLDRGPIQAPQQWHVDPRASRKEQGKHFIIISKIVIRYAKDDSFQKTSLYYETCTKEQCWMLDKMMTKYWLRPKYYENDPYAPYHTRHGLKGAPRVDDRGTLLRERPKILLEDTVADMHFRDR
ncbi:mrpl-35 [Pristionchus pacificus]|uniref:Mrpl-35 n=1 Tax=Pristionchus pacificus TaxID=54126 RepID=A0A2A6C650_PRIPA|nr:mrpl-35 [Pristionchus pacificus]|eukprot:PDM73655.1 mrpl-35 [Pristionchus pacificus]